MNSVSKKKWKSLVAIAKTASEFSGKTGDSYDGRGYFPNKNMSNAVRNSMEKSAKTQGNALVPKMESQYDNVVDWNKGTRYLNVPEKMIKHKVEARIKKSATAHYINTENKMKYIFGESKMKKSDFNNLVRNIISEVVDVLEGKGGQAGVSSSLGSPGQISKGGFTLKDFSAVLGGLSGRSQKSGQAADPDPTKRGETRSIQRQMKLSLFSIDKGLAIDAWRTMVLAGEPIIEKGKYQRKGPGGETSGYKSKDTSSDIDSLASIRNTDDAFRKAGGGVKRGNRESFKVSAKYIGEKAGSIKVYNDVIDNEIDRLRKIQHRVTPGDKNFVAIENLIEDLGLKQDEYSLKWDYAVAAYGGNESIMATARSNIEAKRELILKRAKSVGEGSSAAAQWREDNNYSFGDKVTGSDGKIYTATNFDGEFPADKLGQIDPVLGEDMWVQDKEEGGGETPTWEDGGKYSWGDVVKAKDGSTWKATEGKGQDPEEDLGDTDPLDGSPIWVKQ